MSYKRGGKTPKKFPKDYLNKELHPASNTGPLPNINQQQLERQLREQMDNNPDDFVSDSDFDSDDSGKYRIRKKKTKGKKKKYKRSKSIKKTKGKKKKYKRSKSNRGRKRSKSKKCKRNKSMKINLGRMSNKKLNQLKQRIINILNESKLRDLFEDLKKKDKRFKNISLPKKLPSPSIRNYINKLKIADIKKNIKFFSNNAGNGDDDTCSICFGNIVSNNKTTTRCNHSFCKDCLREWMIQPMARNKCPNCRQPALNREQRRSMGLPIAPPGNTRQRIIRRTNSDGSVTEIRPYTSPIAENNNNTYIFSMIFSYLYFVLNMEHFACVVFAFFIMRYIANMLSPGSFN